MLFNIEDVIEMKMYNKIVGNNSISSNNNKIKEIFIRKIYKEIKSILTNNSYYSNIDKEVIIRRIIVFLLEVFNKEINIHNNCNILAYIILIFNRILKMNINEFINIYNEYYTEINTEVLIKPLIICINYSKQFSIDNSEIKNLLIEYSMNRIHRNINYIYVIYRINNSINLENNTMKYNLIDIIRLLFYVLHSNNINNEEFINKIINSIFINITPNSLLDLNSNNVLHYLIFLLKSNGINY